MVKLVYGKQGDSPFVKVMADDDADPLTTPDSDFGAFLFNSNNQELGYVLDVVNDSINNPDYTWASGTTRTRTFWPNGTGWADADFYTITFRSGSVLALYWYMLLNNTYGNFGNPDFAPFVEVTRGNATTGLMRGPENFYSGAGGTFHAGRWVITTGAAGYTVAQPLIVNPVATPIPEDTGDGPGNMVGVLAASTNNEQWNSTVWDIPGNNVPMDYATATPVPGQEQIRLDSTGIRIARKGFDVDDTEFRNFVLTSDRVPAKIMGTGNITLAANASSDIYTPLPTDETAVMRFMARPSSVTGETWTHPPLYILNQGESSVITYRSFGDYIRVTNSSNQNIQIRYIIFATSRDEPTTGGSQVVRRGDDYIQIKRPGSSDTAPNLNDIILDTRVSYLTMVDEGYIPHEDMNESPSNALYGTIAKTVNFTNDGGFTPYVMYTTVYDAGGGKTFYKSAFIRILFTSTSTPYRFMPARQSSLAEITNSSVKFHLTRGNPWDVFLNASETGYVTTNGNEPNPIGIRYYIFAIPNAL